MEPPEVQKKLMGLLIQYNAVMQYVLLSSSRTEKMISSKLISFYPSKTNHKKTISSISFTTDPPGRKVKAVAMNKPSKTSPIFNKEWGNMKSTRTIKMRKCLNLITAVIMKCWS